MGFPRQVGRGFPFCAAQEGTRVLPDAFLRVSGYGQHRAPPLSCFLSLQRHSDTSLPFHHGLRKQWSGHFPPQRRRDPTTAPLGLPRGAAETPQGNLPVFTNDSTHGQGTKIPLPMLRSGLPLLYFPLSGRDFCSFTLLEKSMGATFPSCCPHLLIRDWLFFSLLHAFVHLTCAHQV